ncbi:MAG: hypothetical protein R3C49_03260 [Planctomycetaceae bacterium]
MREYRLIAALMIAAAAIATVTRADERPDSQLPANQRLKNDQEAVIGRYARFERLLSQMADMLAHEDPERAELLRRAVSKGREQAIAAQLEGISGHLSKSEFGNALEKQTGVTKSMHALLKLLQSEDRRSSVEKERERLNQLLKDLQNNIALQRAARGVTQNSPAPSSAAPDQQKALNGTQEMLQSIQEHDAQKQAEKDAEDAENGKSDESSGNSSEPKASDSQDQKSKPSDEDGKSSTEKTPSSDGKEPQEGSQADKSGKPPSENGMPSEPKSENEPSEEGDAKSEAESSGKSPSQSGESSAKNSKSPEDEQKKDETEMTPGRQQVEEARRLMQEVLDDLQMQLRDKAVEKQDDAISQLQQAARQLEEMLKQLREEEKEMILAALEARFQRMLALQTHLHEATVDLGRTARAEWLDAAVSQCKEVARQQSELTQECSQTAALLREDGTSVSILVAVEDLEGDMGRVALRLLDTKADSLTQAIQTDIIEALKELISEAQEEMEEMKSPERQPPPQQTDPNEKPPLVELMAEIRVLRSLQLRVNRRTRQVNEALQQAEVSDQADLKDQLIELALRQNRLKESAQELGKQLEQNR